MYFLIVQNNDQHILLEKRPPSGIWGGLWSLPECEIDKDVKKICQQRYGCRVQQVKKTFVFSPHLQSFSFGYSPSAD